MSFKNASRIATGKPRRAPAPLAAWHSVSMVGESAWVGTGRSVSCLVNGVALCELTHDRPRKTTARPPTCRRQLVEARSAARHVESVAHRESRPRRRVPEVAEVQLDGMPSVASRPGCLGPSDRHVEDGEKLAPPGRRPPDDAVAASARLRHARRSGSPPAPRHWLISDSVNSSLDGRSPPNITRLCDRPEADQRALFIPREFGRARFPRSARMLCGQSGSISASGHAPGCRRRSKSTSG